MVKIVSTSFQTTTAQNPQPFCAAHTVHVAYVGEGGGGGGHLFVTILKLTTTCQEINMRDCIINRACRDSFTLALGTRECLFQGNDRFRFTEPFPCH